MSIFKSRECSKNVYVKLSKESGYSIQQIEEVINSVYDFINLQIKSGERNPIRIPKLGSFQISKTKEARLTHNIPNGILNRKNELGVLSNVNPKRIEELLKKYKDEFDKDK